MVAENEESVASCMETLSTPSSLTQNRAEDSVTPPTMMPFVSVCVWAGAPPADVGVA